MLAKSLVLFLVIIFILVLKNDKNNVDSLLNMYRTHIIDPETNEVIPLYNDRVMQLLIKGYHPGKLKTYVDEQYNRNTLFTNDLICQFLYYLNSYKNMVSLLLIDKSATTLMNDKSVWEKIFKKHRFPKFGEYNLANYTKMQKVDMKVMKYKSNIKLTFENQNSLKTMPTIKSMFLDFVEQYDNIIVTIYKGTITLYYNNDTIVYKFVSLRSIIRILFELYYFGDQ